MAEAGGVTAGRAVARTGAAVVATAASRSARTVQAEEAGGLLEGVAAQEVAVRMYAPPGAVGSLGWGAAEDEAAARTAAAGSGRLAETGPAGSDLWRVEGSVPVAVVAGSIFVVVAAAAVVVSCSASDHAIGRSLAGGLARSGG